MARVLVIDRVRIRREAIASILRTFGVVSDVDSTSPDALNLAAGIPDIVLLSDPLNSCMQQVCNSIAAVPGTKVIALGLHEDDVARCIEAGCWGYMLVENTLEDLDCTLRAAARHEAPLLRSIPARLPLTCGRRTARGPASARASLTPREEEVLSLLELGMSNKQISKHLSIRVLTVKNHVHNILDKLDVARRGEAVARVRLRHHNDFSSSA